jgi:hypothetical protein
VAQSQHGGDSASRSGAGCEPEIVAREVVIGRRYRAMQVAIAMWVVSAEEWLCLGQWHAAGPVLRGWSPGATEVR